MNTSTHRRLDAMNVVSEQIIASAGVFDAMFKDLHANPELSFEEVRTASVLAASLRKSGFAVTSGVGRTGVVGVLENGPGPRVLLRADMDALPVTEATGVAWASRARGTTPEGEATGIMHACGHDAHTTALAAACAALADCRDLWSGTILAVGQPAEELLAGAAAMLDDGLYERFGVPDVALGQHVGAAPVGTVVHASGPILTATAKIDIIVHGRGGHGATPHSTVDPVPIAAHIITRLQTLVARETDPARPVVVTVGRVVAGLKSNVIPDEALMQLSIRAATTPVLDRLIARIKDIASAEGIAGATPVAPTVRVEAYGGATVNDAQAHDLVRAAHEAMFGESAVWTQRGLVMASEDFGFFGGRALDDRPPIPTHFWFTGSMDRAHWGSHEPTDRDPLPQTLPPGHSPEFLVDPATIPLAARALAAAALAFLD